MKIKTGLWNGRERWFLLTKHSLKFTGTGLISLIFNFFGPAIFRNHRKTYHRWFLGLFYSLLTRDLFSIKEMIDAKKNIDDFLTVKRRSSRLEPYRKVVGRSRGSDRRDEMLHQNLHDWECYHSLVSRPRRYICGKLTAAMILDFLVYRYSKTLWLFRYELRST